MSGDDGAEGRGHVGLGPGGSVVASGGLSWTRVRTPRVLSQVAKGLYAIGALGVVIGTYGPAGVGLLSLVTLLTAGMLFITSYIVSLTQTSFPGSLEIHSDHIGIQSSGGRIAIANDKIRSAMVVERRVFDSSISSVEIELTNGDILVARLADPAAARAVVDALGFGIGGARVHAELAKPTRRLLHPLAGMAAFFLSFWFLVAAAEWLRMLGGQEQVLMALNLSYPALSLALYALFRRLLRSRAITVGDDGVLIRGRLRSRFIPRRDIALVGGAAGTPLFIETRTGERIRASGILLDQARRDSITRVIDERAGPTAAGADRFEHYERGGRPLEEWRAHLARAMNDVTYRVNASTVDEAAAVLRSAQATPEQRIGAALALRAAGQPKKRIRVAVDAAVDDRMREALEAVAESDDDGAIDKAVRRLERS